jgi:hypothetical protein
MERRREQDVTKIEITEQDIEAMEAAVVAARRAVEQLELSIGAVRRLVPPPTFPGVRPPVHYAPGANGLACNAPTAGAHSTSTQANVTCASCLRVIARMSCDVCLYDRHCTSHCPKGCEHQPNDLFDQPPARTPRLGHILPEDF